MEPNQYFEAFGKPFDNESVKWRIQYTNNEKTKGFAVPYADSRAIADRLDAVVGQMCWKDSYTPWHNVTDTDKNGVVSATPSQLCIIEIYSKELGQWIYKTDGACDTDIEPVKGGLSDAFKRAASKWNIGRYLYKFDGIWVEIEARGRSYIIKDSEKTRISKYYADSVAKIFGKQPGAGKPEEKKPEGKQPDAGKPTGKQDKPAGKQDEKPDAAPTKPAQAAEGLIYEVQSVKVNNTESGTNSTVKLKRNDQVITAYLRGQNDLIKNGTKLTNIKLQERDGTYGKYYIIDQYEVAA